MDRFEALKAFVAVAEHRSFRRSGATSLPTAASRAIADLEQALGVTLLRRTTRSVGLTPEGAAYRRGVASRSMNSMMPERAAAVKMLNLEGN